MSFLANGTSAGMGTIHHQENLFEGDAGGTGLCISTNNGVSFSLPIPVCLPDFCQIFSVAQSPAMIMATVDGGNSIKASADGDFNRSLLWEELSLVFIPTPGTNSSGISFFTNKGKYIYRTGGTTGIKEQPTKISGPTLMRKNLNVGFANNTLVNINVYSISGQLL